MNLMKEYFGKIGEGVRGKGVTFPKIDLINCKRISFT